MVQHVLAVAGAVLEATKQLDDLGREARDAGVVGGLFAGLADDQIDLGARLGYDLLDPPGVNSAVGDQLGQGQSGDLAADRVEAGQDHRLGRVVDDQIDAGGLLQSPDVAALAADDPALHLIRWQVDDRDGVLGRVVRGHPLDGGHDDVAGFLVGFLARVALDRPGYANRVVLGVLADGFEEDLLGRFCREATDSFERDHLFLVGSGNFFTGVLDLALTIEQLAVLLLEHVGALVELLIALEEPALEVAELRALAAGVIFGFALEPELFILGLEDDAFLLFAGLCDDASRLLLGSLDRLRSHHRPRDHAEYDSADEGHEGHRHHDGCLHIRPPVRSLGRPEVLSASGRRGDRGVVQCVRSGRAIRQCAVDRAVRAGLHAPPVRGALASGA